MANLADLQAELLRKKSELKTKIPVSAEGNYIRAEKRDKTTSGSSGSIFGKKNKGATGEGYLPLVYLNVVICHLNARLTKLEDSPNPVTEYLSAQITIILNITNIFAIRNM